ncbi:hypothetical protein ACFFGH_07205 [Lysobacter korlensis]|uniref:Uncharacterized protein n=1 Tax=Lysobacter korlensis TaxID=553636 RepID=A0ABV6RKX7_9GAMM
MNHTAAMARASGSPSAPAGNARRVRAGLTALAATLLAISAPSVLASTTSAAETGPRQASASLDFRIVIPETVRFEQGEEQRGRTRQFTSRTVEQVSGRQVVTIARP